MVNNPYRGNTKPQNSNPFQAITNVAYSFYQPVYGKLSCDCALAPNCVSFSVCKRAWNVTIIFGDGKEAEERMDYWNAIFDYAHLIVTKGKDDNGKKIKIKTIKITGHGKSYKDMEYHKSLEKIEFIMDRKTYSYKELMTLEAI